MTTKIGIPPTTGPAAPSAPSAPSGPKIPLTDLPEMPKTPPKDLFDPGVSSAPKPDGHPSPIAPTPEPSRPPAHLVVEPVLTTPSDGMQPFDLGKFPGPKLPNPRPKSPLPGTGDEPFGLPGLPKTHGPHLTPKAEEARRPWNALLPPCDYKVPLTEFKGWERGIPKSILNEGGLLQRQGPQTTLELMIGSQRVTVPVLADGTFKMALRDGKEQLRGQISAQAIVVERWDTTVPTPVKNAEWRSTLLPPFPIVAAPPLDRPLMIDPTHIDPELADLKLGTVTSLIDQPMQVYLGTGFVLTLPPHASARLVTLELASPHVVALVSARLLDVKLEE